MNREKYQELVENAYCSKALSVEAFNPDEELDVWAELEQWSDQSAFDGKGDSVSKTEPETNEFGMKVKGSESPSDGSLNRQQTESSPIVEMGADERNQKEDEVITTYGQLILEFRPLVQDVLIKAVANDYHKNVLKTWRELENHARVIPCCQHSETGAQEYVRYHPNDYSNHEVQLEKFRDVIKEISKLYNIPQSELNKTFSLYKPQPTPSNGVVDPEEKLRKFAIDWRTARSILKEATQKVHLGSSALTLPEINRLKSLHPLLAEFAMRLKILQKKVLHCRHCLTSYFYTEDWAVPSDYNDLEEKKHYAWVSIAEKATRSIIETCVAKAAIRPPRTVVFRNSDGKKEVVSIGSSSSSDYEKSILKEAILSGYAIGDQISARVVDDAGSAWAAHESDQTDYNVYTALGPAVVDRLSGELLSFYPELAAHMNPEITREKWCKSRAIQILYAIQRAGILFNVNNVSKKGATHADGTAFKHNTNMIRLTQEVETKIRDLFTDAEGINWLKEFYGRERLPPMVSQPLARPLEMPDLGGYRTEGMHARKPLVSDTEGRQHLSRARFSPSTEAVEVINSLQNTTWKVDKYESHDNQPNATYSVIKEVLEHEIKSNILKHLTIEKEDGNLVLTFENFKSSVSKIRNGQVREWMDTFRFIDQLHEEFPGKPHFWHAWQFDWRGRMNPTTPMLSPQNDDVCRGLLRFAKPVRLDAEGLKWLGRFTASLFRGRDEKVLDMGNGEAYADLLKKLDDRTWGSFDTVANDPLFLEMIDGILSMKTLDGYRIWGEGDVFRKKAEGFQRYAAMKEFHRVMNEGGEHVESNLPIHLDASSSIYQHASALLRDTEMGQKVNVVPRDDGMPADVYKHVANALRAIWEKEGDFLQDTDLDQDTKQQIMEEVLERSVAKGPVMTKGYGTGHASMTYSLMTHNGDPDGEFGGEITVDDKTRKVVHEESTLGFLYDLDDVGLELHQTIASEVISGYSDAIKEVLPSFDLVLNLLKKLVETNYIEARITAHMEQDKLTEIISSHVGVKAKELLKWPSWEIVGEVNDKEELRKSINESLEEFGWIATPLQPNKKKTSYSFGIRPLSSRINKIKPLAWELPDGPQRSTSNQTNAAMAELLKKEGGAVVQKPPVSGVEHGSVIEHYTWYDNNAKTVKPWDGARSHRDLTRDALRRQGRSGLDLDACIPKTLTKPVDFDTLNKFFTDGTPDRELIDSMASIESERLEQLRPLIDSEEIQQCLPENECGEFAWKQLRAILGLQESDEVITYKVLKETKQQEQDSAALLSYFYPFEHRLSYREISQNRDVASEKTGVAPNFIHSLDALHMRRFVRDMNRANHKDLWAVHDSFGCHANHIGKMRAILRDQFTAIHNLKTGFPNVLLNTVQSVLDKLPMQKLVELSKLWEKNHNASKKWQDLSEVNSDPLQITKQLLGITVLENVSDRLGDMDDSKNNSNYFVN